MKEMFTVVTGRSILLILAALSIVILRKLNNLGYFDECRLFGVDMCVEIMGGNKMVTVQILISDFIRLSLTDYYHVR